MKTFDPKSNLRLSVAPRPTKLRQASKKTKVSAWQTDKRLDPFSFRDNLEMLCDALLGAAQLLSIHVQH